MFAQLTFEMIDFFILELVYQHFSSCLIVAAVVAVNDAHRDCKEFGKEVNRIC